MLDPADRHVLAAAITTAADAILTFNLKDFPAPALARYGVKTLHLDAFLQSLIVAMPLQLLAAARDCVARLTRLPISGDTYLKILRRTGFPRTPRFWKKI